MMMMAMMAMNKGLYTNQDGNRHQYHNICDYDTIRTVDNLTHLLAGEHVVLDGDDGQGVIGVNKLHEPTASAHK